MKKESEASLKKRWRWRRRKGYDPVTGTVIHKAESAKLPVGVISGRAVHNAGEERAELAWELVLRHVRKNQVRYVRDEDRYLGPELSLPTYDKLSPAEKDFVCTILSGGMLQPIALPHAAPGFTEGVHWNIGDCTNDTLIAEFETWVNRQRQKLRLPEPKGRQGQKTQRPVFRWLELMDRADLDGEVLKKAGERKSLTKARAAAIQYYETIVRCLPFASLPPDSPVLQVAQRYPVFHIG